MLEIIILALPVIYFLSELLAKYIARFLPVDEQRIKLLLQETIDLAVQYIKNTQGTEDDAVAYIKAHTPDAVKFFNKSDEDLKQMVKARL